VKLPVSTPQSFPQYSSSEHMLDLGFHVAGPAMGAVGVPLLLVVGIDRAGADGALGLSLYAAVLLAMFAFSASYNLSRRPRRKEILRRFDRAAIFVMIAGTYSPFALAKIAGASGLGLFALVWSLALLGATLAFAFPLRSDFIAFPVPGIGVERGGRDQAARRRGSGARSRAAARGRRGLHLGSRAPFGKAPAQPQRLVACLRPRRRRRPSEHGNPRSAMMTVKGSSPQY
jgi:hypothetical protein